MTIKVQWGESHKYMYEDEFETITDVRDWLDTFTEAGYKMTEGWVSGREGHWFEVYTKQNFTEWWETQEQWNDYDPLK